MALPAPPKALVAMLNASEEVIERLQRALDAGGFRTVAAQVGDVQMGILDLIAWMSESRADVILVDLPRPDGRTLNFLRLQAGATALAFYGTMDAGLVGQACDACRLPDEMHLLDDLFGIIQPGDASLDVPGLTPKSLLCTTLRARAPYLLLNASLGDQAEVTPARCDGPLTRAGWTRQLRAVQNHEKINAGGLTLLDIDVVHVLEEVLPGRFGGGPLDYQLVESLDGDDRAEVRLLVHPRLGPIDADRVAEAFLGALPGDGADRIRQLQWQRGGVLAVERAAPRSTPAGKILHMHQDRVVAEATADRDGR